MDKRRKDLIVSAIQRSRLIHGFFIPCPKEVIHSVYDLVECLKRPEDEAALWPAQPWPPLPLPEANYLLDWVSERLGMSLDVLLTLEEGPALLSCLQARDCKANFITPFPFYLNGYLSNLRRLEAEVIELSDNVPAIMGRPTRVQEIQVFGHVAARVLING